jgi:hypothetical protein
MSSVSYARYTTTGRITGVGHCVISDLPLQAQSGETTLITANVVNNAENYILAGAVTPRTPLPATWNKTSITADGVDEAVLATLPIPCTVYVDDQSIVVDDGSFEFSRAYCNNLGDYCRCLSTVVRSRKMKSVDTSAASTY